MKSQDTLYFVWASIFASTTSFLFKDKHWGELLKLHFEALLMSFYNL
jgi:hypothetical protein